MGRGAEKSLSAQPQKTHSGHQVLSTLCFFKTTQIEKVSMDPIAIFIVNRVSLEEPSVNKSIFWFISVLSYNG